MKCGIQIIHNFGYATNDLGDSCNYEAKPIDFLEDEVVYESTTKIYLNVDQFIKSNREVL